MEKPQYYSVDQLVEMIAEPNRSVCRKILDDNRALFEIAPGSSHNHQAWRGGYLDHVVDCCNIAILFYHPWNIVRPRPYTLSSVILVLFLHDIEKPWKYELTPDGRLVDRKDLMKDKNARKAFRDRKLAEYGISLSDQESNAFAYVEGEGYDYSNKVRVMNELAAFCHACDNLSARDSHDHPRKHDSWGKEF
jgi:hypothetical protein